MNGIKKIYGSTLCSFYNRYLLLVALCHWQFRHIHLHNTVCMYVVFFCSLNARCYAWCNCNLVRLKRICHWNAFVHKSYSFWTILKSFMNRQHDGENLHGVHFCVIHFEMFFLIIGLKLRKKTCMFPMEILQNELGFLSKHKNSNILMNFPNLWLQTIFGLYSTYSLQPFI